jgi:hypothetical protein
VRILVAQAGRDGRWLATGATPDAFAGDSRPRVAVIRFDGSGSPPTRAMLQPFLDRLLERWHAGGAAFAGVEIDYDCASSQLADYAARLRELRATLPAGLHLSITALPAWLDATELDAVLDASDEAVLQVHAVRNPAQGLFNPVLAERWARAFAPHAPHGFRIALPAYAMRVRFAEDGRPIAVESEMPVDAAAPADAREIEVDPAAVAALLARLAAQPPPHWHGVVWFRLPLPGDRRAWTLAALHEVIGGRVPRARLEIDLLARDNGATDLAIANRGDASVEASAFQVHGEGCTAHDAAAGWRIEERGALRFVPQTALRIPAGRSAAAGWVRCVRPPSAIIDQASAEAVKP